MLFPLSISYYFSAGRVLREVCSPIQLHPDSPDFDVVLLAENHADSLVVLVQNHI